jgi:hypothetical protein
MNYDATQGKVGNHGARHMFRIPQALSSADPGFRTHE